MLTRLRRMSASSPRMTPVEQAAEALLVAHQRFDIRGCLCGWAELGKSHPRHQVSVLRDAGLLKDSAERPAR